MNRLRTALLVVIAASTVSLAACNRPAESAGAAPPAAAGPYRVYVTNERSGDLTIIDGATRQVIATVPLGKRPRGVRATADGRLLYIALSGSPISPPGVDESTLPPADKSADGIGVFDVAQNKLVRILRGVSDPEQLAIGDGRLFIASEDTGTAIVLNATDGALLATIPVGGEPEGVNLSPDGRTVWVTSEEDHTVHVIDTQTMKEIKAIEVGERPRNTAFSPDGKLAYVSGEFDRTVKVIDVAALRVVNTVRLPGDTLLPMDVVTSPDGGRIYVSTGRGKMVAALDARALNVESMVEVGARPWGMAISPDGGLLFTANGSSNDVTVVDAKTMTVVAKIPAGASPWGVAVAPAVN